MKPIDTSALEQATKESTDLLKSHVKEFQRRTKSGAVSTVAEHDDSRHPNIIGQATKMDHKDPSQAHTFTHAGKEYVSTGKNGKSMHDDRPVREFEEVGKEAGHRTWLDNHGNVHADSNEEADRHHKRGMYADHDDSRTTEQKIAAHSSDPQEKKRFHEAMHDSEVAYATGSQENHQRALAAHKDAHAKAVTPEIKSAHEKYIASHEKRVQTAAPFGKSHPATLDGAIASSTALLKAHVKQYARKDGTVVKEHDDSRQAAMAASRNAETHQHRMNIDEPGDLQKNAKLHEDAAMKHLAAFAEGRAAGKESAKDHYYKASHHLGSAHSSRTFGRGNEEESASAASKTAEAISKMANKHQTEEKAESLDVGSGLHSLAQEQHHRAADAHVRAANASYKSDENASDGHMKLAKKHRSVADEHGKKSREITGVSIKATDKARTLGEHAKTADDHISAARAHADAAKLDYDKEGRAEHLKAAKWHVSQSKKAGKKEEKKSGGTENKGKPHGTLLRAGQEKDGTVEHEGQDWNNKGDGDYENRAGDIHHFATRDEKDDSIINFRGAEWRAQGANTKTGVGEWQHNSGDIIHVDAKGGVRHDKGNHNFKEGE